MFCPKCGASAAASARFCPKCGAPLSVPRVPSHSPTPPVTDAAKHVRKAAERKEPMQSGSSLWLSVILVAAIIIVAVGAVGICSSARIRTAPDEVVLDDENAELVTIVAEGNAAYSLEDYELALDFYLEAMERFPQEPDVLCRLADAYYALEQNENALQYYQMAVMLYGEDGTMPVVSAQNFYNLTEE